MIPIYAHTQKSYADEIFARLGKGKRHAALLYSEWMREGQFLCAVEKEAAALAEEIIALTDCALPPISSLKEQGETVKFLLKYNDDLESESVCIPMEAGTTLCISSQIGCMRGCTFCETGKMGLIRNLSAAEIVAQVFSARFILNQPVRNIVFMGMGEPFDNFDEVMRAIEILTDDTGLAFGASRITVSTSGNVDGIYKFIERAPPALNLAVSVNAPSDEIRRKIMPVNAKWDMAELKTALAAYCAHPRRKILAEYVLLQGINDSLESADMLADYLEKLQVKVNLIPYNAQSRDRYAPPPQETIDAFAARLRKRNYQVMVRGTKGESIMAACGQLGNLQLRKTLAQRYGNIS